jgi:hypothetical protein
MTEETGRRPNSVKVPLPVWLGLGVVLCMALVVARGTGSNAAVKEPPSSHVDTSVSSDASKAAEVAPQSDAPKPAVKAPVDTAQVKAYLAAGTDFYVQLFQQAQQALGTTQYVDAYAGIAALDDPTSAASAQSRWVHAAGSCVGVISRRLHIGGPCTLSLFSLGSACPHAR